MSIRSRIIIRNPVVDRSRNTVKSSVNIEFQNANRCRGKRYTASDSRVKNH